MKKRIEDILPIEVVVSRVEKGRRVQLTATQGYRTLLYVVKGKLTVNGETIPSRHLVIFEEANDEIILAASEETQILLLSPPPVDSGSSVDDLVAAIG